MNLMLIINILNNLDSNHKQHCNEETPDLDVPKNIQEKNGKSEFFKRTAKKIKLLVLAALQENRGVNSFLNDEESKMYKNFLSKWEKYFQEEESRKRQEVAAMMSLRNNIRQHKD